MLKVIKKHYLRKFIREIDEDFKLSFGDAFEVDIPEEEIFATFNKDEEIDKIFLKFLKKEFNIEIDMFLISLLHEVGHIMTYDDDMNDDRSVVYGLLKVQFDEGKANIEEYNDMYFHIPAEFEATAWGVQYYLENKEKCDKLVRILNK